MTSIESLNSNANQILSDVSHQKLETYLRTYENQINSLIKPDYNSEFYYYLQNGQPELSIKLLSHKKEIGNLILSKTKAELGLINKLSDEEIKSIKRQYASPEILKENQELISDCFNQRSLIHINGIENIHKYLIMFNELSNTGMINPPINNPLLIILQYNKLFFKKGNNN